VYKAVDNAELVAAVPAKKNCVTVDVTLTMDTAIYAANEVVLADTQVISADPAKPRLVSAFDYRGHGQSEYDRNPDNYTLPRRPYSSANNMRAKSKRAHPLSRWAGPN
jgi:hypothetical protein